MRNSSEDKRRKGAGPLTAGGQLTVRRRPRLAAKRFVLRRDIRPDLNLSEIFKLGNRLLPGFAGFSVSSVSFCQ
jgi:hypothetical protein